MICPPPGGAAGFAPAGRTHLADGLRFASRRAGGNRTGPARPRGWVLYFSFAGKVTKGRTARHPDLGCFPVGAPPPNPGVLFPRRKSTQKGDKRERDFDFPLPLITPSPLNDQRRGEPPLWIHPPLRRKPVRLPRHCRAVITRNDPQPEGRQAKCVNHRTDYEGPAATRHLSGCAGCPRRCPIG